MLDKIFIWVILVSSAISTVIMFLESLGFLPNKWIRFFNRKKTVVLLDVLKDLGIDYEKYQRSNLSISAPSSYENQDELKAIVSKKLKDITIKSSMSVGKHEMVNTEEYIDLIGATTCQQNAELYAKYLSTYWSIIVKDKNKVIKPKFDFIVTPKGGSPILGYEFAKLMNKPFILYETENRVNNNKNIFMQRFNFAQEPDKGTVALIVDDSTTGGRMISELINDLKCSGYIVSECLVVFEPKLKKANFVLKELGVNLHSIVETHNKQ